MRRLLLSLAILSTSLLRSHAGAFAADLVGRAPMRSYVSGIHAIQIDGEHAGFLSGVGEFGYTRLVDGKLQPAGLPTTVDVTFGFAFRPLLSWIEAALAGGRPQTVVLAEHDFKFQEQGRYDFGGFTITEIQFPALDAGSKERGSLRVHGQPTKIARTPGTGAKAPGELGKDELKTWIPANFRVTIDGLDTTKVALLGPITVRRRHSGFEIVPFKVSLTPATSASWYEWAEKTLVRGDADNRTLKIEFLNTTRTAAFATLVLGGVSMVSMSYFEKSEHHADSIRRDTFTLAAESIKLILPKVTKGS